MKTGPRKTHCKNGHERTPENVKPNGNCRLCANIDVKKWSAKFPEKRLVHHFNRIFKTLSECSVVEVSDKVLEIKT